VLPISPKDESVKDNALNFKTSRLTAYVVNATKDESEEDNALHYKMSKLTPYIVNATKT
jgi:hypothetical protein